MSETRTIEMGKPFVKVYLTCLCGDNFYVLRPPAPLESLSWACSICGQVTRLSWPEPLLARNDPRSKSFERLP